MLSYVWIMPDKVKPYTESYIFPEYSRDGEKKEARRLFTLFAYQLQNLFHLSIID